MAVYCIKDASNKWRKATSTDEYKNVKEANPNKVKQKRDGFVCETLNDQSTTPPPASSDCTAKDKEQTDAGFSKRDKNTFYSAKKKPTYYKVESFWCEPEKKRHYFVKKINDRIADDDQIADDDTVTPAGCAGVPSTGFNSVDQGNKFRDFVYKYYPSVAGEHDLWLSNNPKLTRLAKSYDTCSMRKSYSEIDQRDPMNRSIGNLFLLWSQDPNALTWLGDKTPQKDMNTPEMQEGVWDQLIGNKQIYTKGLKVNSGGQKVYVIKTDINKPDMKYPLTAEELKTPNLVKYDYLVLYPINLADKKPKGKLGVLYETLNQDGEKIIRIKKDSSWTWLPAEVEEGIELQEQIINRGNRDEAGVYAPGTINRNTNIKHGTKKSVDSIEQIYDQFKNAWVTPKVFTSNEEQRKLGNGETSQGVVSTKDQLRQLFGFVTEEGVTYSPKQKILNMDSKSVESPTFGQGSIQNAINTFGAKSEYFHKYNELMKMEGLTDHTLKLPQGVEGAGEEITEDNYSVLVPSKSVETSNQYKKVTFGTFLETITPKATISLLVGKGSVQKSVGCSCDETTDEIVDKLIEYLVAGLKGDTSMSPNMEGAAREFCGCFKSGVFNDYIKGTLKINVSDLEARGLNIENTPKSFLNKRLGWKEITGLLRGETINGATISSPFRIPDFGNMSCRCLGSGSLNESIKKYTSKAIKEKKSILKEERIIGTILKKLKSLGK
jgi:hypothetical protein